MSKVNWTKEQFEAINIRNTDTLVSAAAGSGKTAVLVERVIKLITDEENPVDIDKLLVVTFTNAAASQMKEKISKAIVSAIEKDPGNTRLRNQLILLGSAEINTIHSFCMNVIRNNIQDTGLPFEFGIVNDTEKEMLKNEAIEEVFAELFEDEELCGDFESFVDSFRGTDDKDAISTCLSLYEFLRSMPYYIEWLKNDTDRDYIENIDDTVWGKYLLAYVNRMLGCASDINGYLCDYLKEYGEEYGLLCYGDSVFGDSERISALKDAVGSGMAVAYEAFSSVKFPQIGRKTKDTDGEAAEVVKNIRGRMCDIIKDIASGIFVQSPGEMCEILNRSQPYYKTLFEVIRRFDEKYSGKKMRLGIVDFSDLEHKCAEILSVYENGEYYPSESALKLRERFCEVLIDEYQDTNLLQETIMSMVSAPGRRFMVGDVKQSIYAFRNSKPELFLEKYDRYARDEGFENRRLLLSKNFRSASHILEFVNFIFSHLMTKDSGGLDYGDDEKLYFGGGYENSDTTDIYIFDKASYDDELDAVEREALFCASKVREMVDSGYEIEDGGSMRSCNYSDFTIIMRNSNKHTDVYRNAFDLYNIPLYVEKGKTYFDAPEIKLMVSLLRVIDNPRQDVELVAVLRSHIFGFSDDLLVEVRMCDRFADFYTCLKRSADSGMKEAVLFFETLERWRFIAGNAPVSVLCDTLIDECSMTTVYPEGADKLRALCDWAERYGKTSYKGLFRFITFLQNQIDANEDIGGNGIPSQNCVTLMSIHKSKGLENGIVILADTARDFNTNALKASMMFNDKLGLTAYYADTENRIKYTSISRLASEYMYLCESRDEEQRLLYVALTRAKFKLIIIGSLRNFESKVSGLKSLAVCKNAGGYSFVSAVSCKNYLDLILSALVFHPGCEILHRTGADITEKEMVDFGVNILVNPDIPEPEATDICQLPIVIPDENYAKVKDILEYEYPYKEATSIPFKLSVSEIKSKFYAELTDDEAVFYPRSIDSSIQLTPEPMFMRESAKLTSAAIGSAYHNILQYIDFGGYDDINLQLDRFADEGIITKAERDAVDASVLQVFLDSDICKDIARADAMYREYSFIMPFDSSKLYGGVSEKVIVQGIIDCVYQIDGEFYVVDYKSDYYSSALEIADRYRTQLVVYSQAVEKKLGKKPVKCMLYMLRSGEVISI